MGAHEQDAQEKFDRSLLDIYRLVALVALVFLTAMVVSAIVVSQSIRGPLQRLMTAMSDITYGHYDRPVHGTSARDEIGDMARAVEGFRDNAIAKRKAEEELRSAKDRAEHALVELRDTQQDLIEAEKLAALGGLVAGIAHEVNNPVGISLTVASSFARRCGNPSPPSSKQPPLRRSRLDEFVSACHAAAGQLVANLQRAGELIQSFKQVAVDRSHADRRQFDLAEATDQIIASLRPALKTTAISLRVDIPPGIAMDSYPGSGQVLTNLLLNAIAHAFPDGRAGALSFSARAVGANDVEVTVADDGVGMDEATKAHAFDPFFTTRRNRGGTGLGLHIIHSLITQSLGGRIAMEASPGRGTSHRHSTDSPRGRGCRSHGPMTVGEQDDFIQIIDDAGETSETGPLWKVAVIDDDLDRPRRHALRARRLPTCPGTGWKSSPPFSAKEGRELMQAHPDTAAVLLDVMMETDEAGLDLVQYIRNDPQERDVASSCAPASPAGPGAARHRRLRHQRLQGEDRAHRRQAVHLAHRGAAQLSAAAAHRRDPARPGDHHRRRLDALRLQFDAASRRRRAHPDRLAAQCRLRRYPGAAPTVPRPRTASRCSPGSGCYSRFIGLPGINELDDELRTVVKEAFRRRDHQFLARRSVLYIRTGSGRRARRAARSLEAALRHRPRAHPDILEPAFGRVRQRHPLRAAPAGQHPPRGARAPAHPRAHPRPIPAVRAMDAAAAGECLQDEVLGTVAHDLRNPLAVILGRTEMLTEMVGTAALSPRASTPRSATSGARRTASPRSSTA